MGVYCVPVRFIVFIGVCVCVFFLFQLLQYSVDLKKSVNFLVLEGTPKPYFIIFYSY